MVMIEISPELVEATGGDSAAVAVLSEAIKRHDDTRREDQQEPDRPPEREP